MPRLADELEALVQRLKETEREAEQLKQEVQVERRLRAKFQKALGSAEATIQKLRAAPTPPRAAPIASPEESAWPPAMRCTGSAASFNPMNSGAGSSARGVSLVAGTTRGSLRDSACKQLLQSPSISSPGACSPIPAVDDASDRQMASPKELPGEHSRFLAPATATVDLSPPPAAPCDESPRLQPRALSAVDRAALPGVQPPLYGWMREMLLAATPQSGGEASERTADSDTTFPRQLRTPQQLSGGTLAVTVRTVLGSSPAPPVLYGTPLHRRIQTLLAEHRTPPATQLTHASAQAGNQYRAEGRMSVAGGHDMLCTRPTGTDSWDRSSQTESPSDSQSRTETSGSYCTPREVGNLSALEQRKSMVSPFHPLRERYGRGPLTAEGSRSPGGSISARPSPEPESPTSAEPPPDADSPEGPLYDSQLEAEDIIAKLGLAEVAEAADHMELLAHVELWAQDQYMAAKRAMLDNAEPCVSGDEESSLEEGLRAADDEAYYQGLAEHLGMVDMAVQTEPMPRQVAEAAQCSRSAAELHDMGTAITPRSPLGSATTAAASPAATSTQDCKVYFDDDDDIRNILSPARSDQLKHSPVALRMRAVAASFEFRPSPGAAVAGPSGASPCTGKAPSHNASTPARRGLFGDAASGRKAAAGVATRRSSPKAADNANAGTGPGAAGTAAVVHSMRAGRAAFPRITEIQPCDSPARAGPGPSSAAQRFGANATAGGVMSPVRTSGPGAASAAPRGCGLPYETYRPPDGACSPVGRGPQQRPMPSSPAPAELVPFLQWIEPDIDWRGAAAEDGGAAPAAHEASPAAPAKGAAPPFVAHVMMTPGHAAGGRGRRSFGRIFNLAAGNGGRQSGTGLVEIEGHGGSGRQLSSISSISIIKSDDEEEVVVDERCVPAGFNRAKSHNTPRGNKRPFFGFLASLSSCSRAPDAF